MTDHITCTHRYTSTRPTFDGLFAVTLCLYCGENVKTEPLGDFVDNKPPQPCCDATKAELADFKREVSEAVKELISWPSFNTGFVNHRLSRFIQPDPVKVDPWPVGTRVTKIRGSRWTGKVVGHYSTELTPEGYAVESETEKGSVQIYPRSALTITEGDAK